MNSNTELIAVLLAPLMGGIVWYILAGLPLKRKCETLELANLLLIEELEEVKRKCNHMEY